MLVIQGLSPEEDVNAVEDWISAVTYLNVQGVGVVPNQEPGKEWSFICDHSIVAYLCKHGPSVELVLLAENRPRVIQVMEGMRDLIRKRTQVMGDSATRITEVPHE